MIVKLAEVNLNRGGTVEKTREEVKELFETLEKWVLEIVKVEGTLQFEHVGKRIKSDREIANKVERKIDA